MLRRRQQPKLISIADLDVNIIVHHRKDWPFTSVVQLPARKKLLANHVLHTTQKELNPEYIPESTTEKIPALIGVYGDRTWIIDGHHRIAISRLIGEPYYPVYVAKHSISSPYAFCIKDAPRLER